MLTHRTTLQNPEGSVAIDMPRLVPSFSSKGFPVFEDEVTGQKLSEVSNALELTGPVISDSILLSAYDIFHNYLRDPERFFGNKELIFIDSGGYELSSDFDSTEPKQGQYKPDDKFNLEAYRKVLSELSTKYPIVIANFDYLSCGKSLEEQIREAQKLFKSYPKFFHCFIVKPTGRKKYVNVPEVIQHVEKMRRFQILGVTEKELGSNLLERLTNIARLRGAMNRSSVHIPIQVWGGLDPVISPLYFCAGAEIFDGVSWLRYGYYSDTAISRDAYTAIELGVQTKWRHAETIRLAKNISYLEDLTIRMRRFVDEGGHDFNVFGAHAKIIKRGYQALCTEVPELKGGA
jgi:hypothetical protein